MKIMLKYEPIYGKNFDFIKKQYAFNKILNFTTDHNIKKIYKINLKISITIIVINLNMD
jgi:hypothetical protein